MTTSHQCQDCQLVFPSRNKLFIHLSLHRSGLVPENESSLPPSPPVQNPLDEVKLVAEDDECKVILKPQGVATMGSRNASDNLYKHPLLLMPERFVLGGKYRKATPCHRLDSVTGGLLVCSKSKASAVLMNQCFRRKLVLKRYVAIIPRALPRHQSDGFIVSEIDGKPACTYFRVEGVHRSRQYGEVSTLHLWPITGRKHQLRRQLKELGHPIIGDPRFSHAYEFPQLPAFRRLFLWAVEIRFPRVSALREKFPLLHLPDHPLAPPTPQIPLTPSTPPHTPDSPDTPHTPVTALSSEDQHNEGGDTLDEDNTDDCEGEEMTWQELSVRSHSAAIFSTADVMRVSSFSIESFFDSRCRAYDVDPLNEVTIVSIPEPSYYQDFRFTESE
mmetsp:Transcript_18375/g.19966  ORF Transcript_18375/g.19966 Transcript_18375/m.19966 type:complete len:387 (+) Transcript_18375:52-1212(+)